MMGRNSILMGRNSVMRWSFVAEEPVPPEKRADDGKRVREWARSGNVQALVAALDEDPTLYLSEPDDNGYHPLHWAVAKSHLSIVRVLIMRGAELEGQEHLDQCTPLLLAVKHEHTQVSALLIEGRANVRAEDRYGHCMLRWAAKSNQHRTLQQLLDARGRAESAHHAFADDDIRLSTRERDGDVNEALRVALRAGYAESVRVLFNWVGELVLPTDLSDFMDDDLQRRTAVRALLYAYSSLQVEGLGRCVARAFKRWPCATLEGLINLAAASKRLSSRLRTRDMILSEALTTSAERLQLAVPACLHELGDQLEVNKLLRSHEGEPILPLAVRTNCKLLLAQPTVSLSTFYSHPPLSMVVTLATVARSHHLKILCCAAPQPVQHFLQAEWLGELIEECLSTHAPLLWLARTTALGILLLLQLPILPFVSAYPPIENRFALLRFEHLFLERLFVRVLGVRTDRPYMLDVPIIKFGISMFLDFVLTVIITSASLEKTRDAVLLLGWVAAAFAFELEQAASAGGGLWLELRLLFRSDVSSQFGADMFNLLDMWALAVANVAIVMVLIEPRESYYSVSNPILAIAIFFMWLRALRILAQFPSLGPLVLMVAKMTKDVMKWIFILVAILNAFVSGMHRLYQGPGSSPAPDELDHDCIDFDADFDLWSRTLLLLLEGTLTSENWLECARHSSHAVLGSIFMYGCQTFVAVLLFNMLIAMMAKTFDHVWEAQELNFQFLMAQTVLSWRGQPTNPPPFNWLRLPWHLAAASTYVWSLCCRPAPVEAEPQPRQKKGSITSRTPLAMITRRRGVPRADGRISVFARNRTADGADSGGAGEGRRRAAPGTKQGAKLALPGSPSGSPLLTNRSNKMVLTDRKKNDDLLPIEVMRKDIVGGHVAGAYADSEFFGRWNNKHPQEVLAHILAESILRHENDYVESAHPLKAESVEKLVTARIEELKGSIGKQVETMASENAEVLRQLAEQGAMLGALLQERGLQPISEVHGHSTAHTACSCRETASSFSEALRSTDTDATVRYARELPSFVPVQVVEQSARAAAPAAAPAASQSTSPAASPSASFASAPAAAPIAEEAPDAELGDELPLDARLGARPVTELPMDRLRDRNPRPQSCFGEKADRNDRKSAPRADPSRDPPPSARRGSCQLLGGLARSGSVTREIGTLTIERVAPAQSLPPPSSRASRRSSGEAPEEKTGDKTVYSC